METPDADDTVHGGITSRVGLLLPSSNILTEREFARLSPDNVRYPATRLKVAAPTARELDSMVAEVETAADLLGDTGPDLLVFACTSGSFLKGRDYDRELAERIRACTGIATVTTSSAIDRALAVLGATGLTVVTPYQDDLNARGARFLEECGYRVRTIRGFGESDGIGLASYCPQRISQFTREVFDPASDAVLLLCTNFRGTEAIVGLERTLGVPVVSSNQATLWAALRMLGATARDDAPGTLLGRTGARVDTALVE